MSRILLLTLIVLFSGCSDQSQLNTFEGNAMTMQYRIVIASPLTYTEKNQIDQVISNTFHEVNTVYNIWNPNSELSQINHLPGNTEVIISDNLSRMLHLTDKIVSLTQGRFDPTVYPLQKIWKKHLEKGILPPNDQLELLKPAIGWDKIHFSENTIKKDHSSTSIDLGGIAKGYCVDLLTERLNALGYPNLYVEWGGEIRVSGKHPDNRPWRIFITSLGNTDPDSAIATIEMENQAIATSGDYMQFWTVRDESGRPAKYTHVINPKTGKPLTKINSASILATNCTLADGLATAALLFDSKEESEAWLSSINEEISFWLK